MKQTLLLTLSVLSLFTSCASCGKNRETLNTGEANNNYPTPTGSKMKIKIGTSIFTATLYDNATATAFKSLLPMTVSMVELNGNEKYYDLPGNPADQLIQSPNDPKWRFDDLWL